MQTIILFIVFSSVILACLLYSFSINKNKKEYYHTPISFQFTGRDLEFFNLLNEYRRSLNLPILKGEKLLTELAIEFANDETETGVASHYGNGQREIKADAKHYGEVTIWNYKTPESQLKGYKNSIGHNKILIGDFTHVGIAEDGIFQCVIFGKY